MIIVDEEMDDYTFWLKIAEQAWLIYWKMGVFGDWSIEPCQDSPLIFI